MVGHICNPSTQESGVEVCVRGQAGLQCREFQDSLGCITRSGRGQGGHGEKETEREGGREEEWKEERAFVLGPRTH